MTRFITFSVFLAASLLTVSSCTKKDPPQSPVPAVDTNGTASVKFEFANKVGSEKLSLNDKWYKNESGDSFQVKKFNYYISNITLVGKTKTYVEQESYHLLQQDSLPTLTFDLKNVPYGEYESISLMIGVDSARNVSGAQTGALDPINGMFWTWKTGYIMLKFEAVSPASTAFNNIVSYHAGGFGGPSGSGFGTDYPTQRKVTLTLPSAIKVAGGSENHVHVEANVLSLFKPFVFSFATTPTIMENSIDSKNLADNYSNMLNVTYSGL